MLRLVPNPTFKARVPFSVPGEAEPAIVEIEFAHRAPKALAAWFESSRELPVAVAMGEVIRGWSGVVDDTGAEVIYSQDALTQFLGNSSTRGVELLRAYVRELTESRIKN